LNLEIEQVLRKRNSFKMKSIMLIGKPFRKITPLIYVF
jgi:hypothetical protein